MLVHGLILASLALAGAGTQQVKTQDELRALQSEIKAVLMARVNTERYSALDDAQLQCDLKQTRLEDHYRQGPLGELPRSMLRFMKPSSERSLPNVQAASSITLLTNTKLLDLATADLTSTVCEPSLAVRGDEILYTGNWFSAFSTDAGQNFAFRDPGLTFSDAVPAGTDFCCDQIAIYDPVHDAMFWLLQYTKDSTGNTLRIGVAQGADIATESWRYFDFTPQAVGNWQDEWFDYPDLVVTNDYLYVTSNVFSTFTDQFTRSLIMRIPLKEITRYEGFSYNYFSTSQYFSLRAVHGADDTMYFAAHENQATLRVFSWPEQGTDISVDSVSVDSWSTGFRVAPGPDGRDWVGRADQRITGAWRTGDKIGFAWCASQDGNYTYPHVRVAILDRHTKAILVEPHLWSDDFAYAYLAGAPNGEGRVGVTVLMGGNMRYPGHAVGVLEEDNTWNLVSVAEGTDGPHQNSSGDYLSIRPHGQQQDTWVATGFALSGGGDRRDIVPRYVHFKVGPGGDNGGPEPVVIDPTQFLNKLGEVEARLQELRDMLEQLGGDD